MKEKIVLLIIVFFTGAIIMALEVTGTRLLNPYFGNQYYIWGSQISTVMLAMSLGYYSGGVISDRVKSLVPLGFIVLSSGLFTLLIPQISSPINKYIRDLQMDVGLSSLISSLILFTIPCLLIAMVSPYVVRLSIRSLEKVGNIAGTIYAVSTFGSIFGTIITSFYLYEAMGIKTIIFMLGSMLIAISILIFFLNKSRTFDFYYYAEEKEG